MATTTPHTYYRSNDFSIFHFYSFHSLFSTTLSNKWEFNPTSNNQSPRCKQRGIKLAALQISGVFDPRGSRQMLGMPLGSLPAEIKNPFYQHKYRYMVHHNRICIAPNKGFWHLFTHQREKAKYDFTNISLNEA